MEKNCGIGIFDSGIGGITVLQQLIKVLPQEDYFYYSDSIHNPYGDKSDTEIYAFCHKIVRYFIKQNCKAVVIACNTASSKVAEKLRKTYPELIIIAIEPAYKMVHDYAYEEPTLVMATKGTIGSEKFNLLYHKYNNHKTYLLPCPGLADLIEKNETEKISEYLKKKLGIYQGKVKNVVLGCTHYPLIKEPIKSVLGEVTFFEGSYRLAIHLKEMLKETNILNEQKQGNITFLDSSQSKEKQDRFWELLKNS